MRPGRLTAQLDPEEWREMVAGYHRAAAEAITRFGGHVAKYLGDGVMAYFGWPEAHDDDGYHVVIPDPCYCEMLGLPS